MESSLDTIATYSIAFGITQLLAASALLIYSLYKKGKTYSLGKYISIPCNWTKYVLSTICFINSYFMDILFFSFFKYVNISPSKPTQKQGPKMVYDTDSSSSFQVSFILFIMLLNPIVGFATIAKILAFGVITNGLSYIFSLK